MVARTPKPCTKCGQITDNVSGLCGDCLERIQYGRERRKRAAITRARKRKWGG